MYHSLNCDNKSVKVNTKKALFFKVCLSLVETSFQFVTTYTTD